MEGKAPPRHLVPELLEGLRVMFPSDFPLDAAGSTLYLIPAFLSQEAQWSIDPSGSMGFLLFGCKGAITLAHKAVRR